MLCMIFRFMRMSVRWRLFCYLGILDIQDRPCRPFLLVEAAAVLGELDVILSGITY